MAGSARGSWPILLALAAAFLFAFAWQRGRSSFRAIAADADRAAAVAAQHGLTVADAMALRDLAGAAAPDAAWEAAAALFAAERARLGDALAAVAAAGDRDAADAALRSAGDPDGAWLRFRVDARALPGLRFLQLRERFAACAPRRD